MLSEAERSVASVARMRRAQRWHGAARRHNKKMAYMLTVLLDDSLSFVVAAIMAPGFGRNLHSRGSPR